MESLLLKGWTLEEATVEKGLVAWAKRVAPGEYETTDRGGIACSNSRDCDKVMRSGAQVFILRNKKGKVRALFCSVECERKKFVDALAELEKRKRRPNRAGS
ncbi:MAG: hypothetical protein A2847_00050 [Candidatus Sungbacteria bacterium RIFCSPHIGHO2_01_FULL_50_25]|uniref:Uncharacterized protein n=1 Tax=Candidatus Sungbacteria bacterium RIFCSPHIGHO2_01_FULL_50_25 TaxID=1802265 RepID=A0A1G2K9E2_9BACT|nr:MAG: hypothetical protein A2847_00050 [Candidatus Sungbacteria bacterium RIFCSPHIGHO2_01_FULL_50_25]